MILRNVYNFSLNETSDIAYQCATTHYNSIAFIKCPHGSDICGVFELNMACNTPYSHCNVSCLCSVFSGERHVVTAG